MKEFINTFTKCCQRDTLKVTHLLSGTVECKCLVFYLHSKCAVPLTFVLAWLLSLSCVCGIWMDVYMVFVHFCFDLDFWILVSSGRTEVGIRCPPAPFTEARSLSQTLILLVKLALLACLIWGLKTPPSRVGNTGRLLWSLSAARLLGIRTLNRMLAVPEFFLKNSTSQLHVQSI